MELQFEKREIPCLVKAVNRVQNLELTQEVRLPEDQSEAGRILGCHGQVLIRSKEWNRDALTISGGIMVWVMYEPETDAGIQTAETWIPFKMDWDIPANCPEGTVRAASRLRYADARQTGAGKLLIRAGVGILAECLSERRVPVFSPKEASADLELLKNHWPLQLLKESGEKVFTVEEELQLPPTLPGIQQLLHAYMDPVVTDQKVLGNRIVFRGNGNLHMLYVGEDGRIHGHCFELPFSQYDDLRDIYSENARADIRMAVTRLEPERNVEGNLVLKSAVTGQYLITDQQLVETLEDAYSLKRELEIHRAEADLPCILDVSRETMSVQIGLQKQTGEPVDVMVLADFPRYQRRGDTVELEQTGLAQILYYDNEGHIQSDAQKWESSHSIPADPSAVLEVLPGQVQVQIGTGINEDVQVRIPMQLVSMSGQGIPQITGLTLGEEKRVSSDRPSLILRRAGEEGLWNLARQSGSTMEAIRRANHLETDPAPGQMLLIPVM